MSNPRTFVAGLSLSVAALLCFVAGCGTGSSGTVVDVQHSSVTVAEPDTYEQTTYKVSPDAVIQRDGAPASLLEIQPGDEIDVTVSTDSSGNEVATAVNADSTSVTNTTDADDNVISDDDDTDDNAVAEDDDVIGGPFPPTDTTPDEAPADPMTYEGRVTTTLDGAMMIEQGDDQEVQIMVDEQADVLVDGVAAEFADILPGYEVMVVVDEDYGQLHALRIEATSATVVDPAPLEEPLPDATDDEADLPNDEVAPSPDIPRPQP